MANDRSRKKLLSGGEARSAAEDLSGRQNAIDAAVEAAVSGKDPNQAKQREVKEGRRNVPTEKRQRKREKKRARGQTIDPGIIQKILDAVIGR